MARYKSNREVTAGLVPTIEPRSPREGDLYYNDVDNQLKVYNGSSWDSLAPSSETQPVDAELTAIAGLTSAADKGIQFTGSGTASTYDLTTAGKALLDDADASTQRTTLGVVLGTDVQAYDADLTALAGLTSAADKGIQFTGSGTAAVYDLTTAGKALLDDADASAQRDTLGLGSIATHSLATILSMTQAQAQVVSGSGGGGSSTLGGLTDTTITTPANNHFFVYNGNSWINETDTNTKTRLGLVIGTNVQAYDAALSAVSGTNTGDQTLPTDFVSKASGGTFLGTIAATNLSGTNTGDQTLPTDFVSKASGGVFGSTVRITGNLDMEGNIIPYVNTTYNIGSASYKFNNVYATTFNGTATSANWSDLAERYHADEIYDEGTLLSIGGEKEVTLYHRDLPFAGVVSYKPGLQMNNTIEKQNDPYWPFVCLTGRIPVKINGPAIKGNYIVGDDNGKAKAVEKMTTNQVLVGIALVDSPGISVEVKV